MNGRVEIDGKFFRYRRGKLVEIPTQWVNKIPTGRTMRARKTARMMQRKTPSMNLRRAIAASSIEH